MAVSKVKGHATEKEVEDGTVEQQDKLGNDEADKAVQEGKNEHLAGARSLANWLAARQEAYNKFMHRRHNYILRMVQADKEARDNKLN